MKFSQQPSNDEARIKKGIQEGIAERIEAYEKEGKDLMLTIPNPDPISQEDYQSIFSKFIRSGDIILAVGVGSINLETGNPLKTNYQLSTLSEITKVKGAELLITDIQQPNLTVHKDNQRLRNNTHTYLAATDATELPLRDASVNGVASSNLINCPTFESKNVESLQEQAELLLKEFFRVLVPGGFVVVTSFGYMEERLPGGIKRLNNSIKYEDVMTLRSLEKYLEEAGFDDVRELTVDDEVVDYPEKDSGGLVRLIESGGFIAFKPKK